MSSTNSDKSLKSTIAFYENNATEYFKSSSTVEMTHLYPSLLDRLPIGTKILDAGCGSGRDAKYFKDNGYIVSAFDASLSLSILASEYSGVEVKNHTFETIQYIDEFDAVWACASLLHLSPEEVTKALRNLTKACKDRALMYISLKAITTKSSDGRHFYCYKMEDIDDVFSAEPFLSVIRYWYTDDSLNRASTKWLNLLLKVTK
jgi:SAM-dependent methyltransferase